MSKRIILNVDVTDIYTSLHITLSRHPELCFMLEALEDAKRIAEVGYITREYTDRALLEELMDATKPDADGYAVRSVLSKIKQHLER